MGTKIAPANVVRVSRIGGRVEILIEVFTRKASIVHKQSPDCLFGHIEFGGRIFNGFVRQIACQHIIQRLKRTQKFGGKGALQLLPIGIGRCRGQQTINAPSPPCLSPSSMQARTVLSSPAST